MPTVVTNRPILINIHSPYCQASYRLGNLNGKRTGSTMTENAVEAVGMNGALGEDDEPTTRRTEDHQLIKRFTLLPTPDTAQDMWLRLIDEFYG